MRNTCGSPPSLRLRYARRPRLAREAVEAALYKDRVPPEDEDSIAYTDAETRLAQCRTTLREQSERLEEMNSYYYELMHHATASYDLYALSAQQELEELRPAVAEQEARVADLE